MEQKDEHVTSHVPRMFGDTRFSFRATTFPHHPVQTLGSTFNIRDGVHRKFFQLGVQVCLD